MFQGGRCIVCLGFGFGIELKAINPIADRRKSDCVSEVGLWTGPNQGRAEPPNESSNDCEAGLTASSVAVLTNTIPDSLEGTGL